MFLKDKNNFNIDWNNVQSKPTIKSGTGSNSCIIGAGTTASATNSLAEGNGTIASGADSHAEGRKSEATGTISHAEGFTCIAKGNSSHAQNFRTQAIGNYSHSGGYYTIAQGYAQSVFGKYNVAEGVADNQFNTLNIFIVGNGTSDTARNNALRLDVEGNLYVNGGFFSNGADYAEMFEWSDNNINNEDRRGYFVTFDGSNKIRKANSSDEFILGIVSTNPSLVGDNYSDHWCGKYIKDEWDNVVYDIVTTDDVKQRVPRINPLYNENVEYTPRMQRQEWASIGLLGKLIVYSDGSCKVGDFCKPNDEGIATKSNSGYYVLEVMDNNIIKVLVK